MFNKKDAKKKPRSLGIAQSETKSKTEPRKRLPEYREKSATVLLRDWLKIKAEKADRMAISIQEALGLLYWLETI